MDLEAILKKTKKASDKVERNRAPVYIAEKDRPYALEQEASEPTTKYQQSANKVTSELTTKCQQSTNSKTTKYQQSANKVTSELTTELTTKYQQSTNKVTSNRLFSELIGLQQSITLLIYNECKKNRSDTTNPITVDYLVNQLNSEKKTLKTSIYRLEKKGVIIRKEFKNGRGGWTRYSLPNEIYAEILQCESNNKVPTNSQQSTNKVTSELASELTTSIPSSSSNKYLITTTNLPTDWINIDYSAITNIGFGEHHLIQFYKDGKLTPEVIQDSINHFAFDLKQNDKRKEIKTNPLSYFIGILKRTGLYTAPENYESISDRKLRDYLRQKKEQKEQRDSMEHELMRVEYESWVKTIDEQAYNSILPENIRNSRIEAPKTAALRSYYEKNIWPERKYEIFSELGIKK